jgi:GTP cyclohydrolase IA
MNFHTRMLKLARHCNEALDQPLDDDERTAMIKVAAQKVEELFDVLRIDHRNDHNTRETPQRVAKMFVEEILQGRYTAPPRITEFDNAQAYDQLIVTGPLEIRSMCAHHLMPIYGHAVIGILPAADGKIIGLSKYDRIVEYFASRLQIQEELVKQIGQYIMDATRPRGLAVRVSAVHMCKTQRGVRASRRSRMVNTYYWGEMAKDAGLKSEFMHECVALDRSGAE